MEDNYFGYLDILNIDLLIEITTHFDENVDVKSLSYITNTWDNPLFWKRLVFLKHPKRYSKLRKIGYKRDYDYRTLYIDLIEYNKGPRGRPLFALELTSFLVYEDIMPRKLQKEYHTIDILTKNKDIDAIKKVLSENPEMVNLYSWTKISGFALETENIDIINYTLKYLERIEGIESIIGVFSIYIGEVGNDIPDYMVEYMMNHPGSNKISLVVDMANSGIELGRLLSIIEKYNIIFEDIEELFSWFEYTPTDHKIDTLKYMIKTYPKLFNIKENVDFFLNSVFSLIKDENDESIRSFGNVKRGVVDIIYSLPILKKEYS